ncbi:MAG TPA: aminomethyl-transferring glycine dehydrogenase [Bacteroidota bacterium]|nr:aminomethyl-transferring glycine dehydrogenase [Bacteroidota bacterium]
MSDAQAFSRRHIGPDDSEIREMLAELGVGSLEELILSAVPERIRTRRPLDLPAASPEHEVLRELREMASRNKIYRSFIGMGYADTITPAVIQRNVLENPGWYTAYTPYQAEIAQGRLEALVNFQTMVVDLTGLEIANASLLDEATAAAEAMRMFQSVKGLGTGGTFFVSKDCHPQTIDVVRTRAKPLGISVVVGDWENFRFTEEVFGALLQYPTSAGAVHDYAPFCERAHNSGALVAVAADLLSLTLLKSPGEFGADAAVGNTQRFGVPLGYGGPHAAYFATRDSFKRLLPGRIIGVSVDAQGRPALRMALQTREQHIRREKATSNICTAQVLLAVMASMYAVYHGPEGLKEIAGRIHRLTKILAAGLKRLGFRVLHEEFFDTIHCPADYDTKLYLEAALRSEKMNVRWFEDYSFAIALDELSSEDEVDTLLQVFGHNRPQVDMPGLAAGIAPGYEGSQRRTSGYMTHPVFNVHQSETNMLRYIRSLEERDLSLTTSMIPLGSCTMKLNATTELIPVSWWEFSEMHPFAPVEQAEGYHELFTRLASALKEITGFSRISLQPNSGAQGEYAGLLAIRAYHEKRGDGGRDVCLIPSSAHGTNPASAVMAGMRIVVVQSRPDGTIDVDDLGQKARQHSKDLAAFMVTYPSTHGVFEEGIIEICDIIHRNGGLVYMDGANMNAQVGLCRPAELGADVCHLNLHKTFCIPHGGGGPGVGPIGVVEKLAPFLPTHPVIPIDGNGGVGAVAAAPWGSAGILMVSWAYIALMGPAGLTHATRIAILNANYMAKRLEGFYPVLYRAANGTVAHEFIIDARHLKESSGIEAEDIAKRLIDYGFHAPTVSFPVAGTLMIEPTESEAKGELDRYCDALIAIRREIEEIERGEADRTNNVLKNAPHTAEMIAKDEWSYPYSREKAAFPAPWTRSRKFWPAVGRINSAYGDRHLVCTCPPVEAYGEVKAEA